MRLSFLINDKNGKLNFEKSLCKNFLAKKKSRISGVGANRLSHNQILGKKNFSYIRGVKMHI